MRKAIKLKARHEYSSENCEIYFVPRLRQIIVNFVDYFYKQKICIKISFVFVSVGLVEVIYYKKHTY